MCRSVVSNVPNRFFAFLHIKAFSYLPYRLSDQVEEPPPQRLKNLAHAFNFMETWYEIRDGSIYMWLRWRGIEPEPDSRQYHFESVMGRERPRMERDFYGRQHEIVGKVDKTIHMEKSFGLAEHPVDPSIHDPAHPYPSAHPYSVDLDDYDSPPPSIIQQFSSYRSHRNTHPPASLPLLSEFGPNHGGDTSRRHFNHRAPITPIMPPPLAPFFRREYSVDYPSRGRELFRSPR